MKKQHLSLLLCFGFLSIFFKLGKKAILLLVLTFLFSPNVTLGGPYQFATPAAQNYFDKLNSYKAPIYSTPKSSGGTISGAVTINDVVSSAGLGAEYYKTIDYLVFQDTVGAGVGINLYSSGPVTYNYQIPFSVQFDFPEKVYPGQRIYLAPIFQWGGDPTLTSNQQYNYYTSFNIGVNPPVLPEFSLGFTQYSDSANISAKIAGYDVSASLDFYPFNQGGGSYGGNYNRLGGTGVLNNTGQDLFNQSSTGVSIANNGVSDRAWEQSQEQFELAANVLSYIFPPAGAALYAVQSAADLDLWFKVYGQIGRTDVINLNVASLPYIDAPNSLTVEGMWDFSTNPIDVVVPYYYNAESRFYYELGMDITFDAALIDEVRLIGWDDILAIPAGSSISPYDQGNFSFKINSGSVPVVDKEAFRQLYGEYLIFDSNSFLEGIAQPIMEANPYQHIIPEGLRVATYNDLYRSVNEYTVVPEPATMLLLLSGLLGLFGFRRKLIKGRS